MAWNLRIVQAGVNRVVAELLLRDYPVFVPSVDDSGVDVILGNGVRIQVKSARWQKRTFRRFIQEAYWFSLGNCQKGVDHRYMRRPKSYSEECDFVIFHGITENRYWIVPSFFVDSVRCLSLGKKEVSTVQLHEMLKAGKCFQQIAKEVGIDHHTVAARIRGKGNNGGWIRAVRLCEDRWDFLESPAAYEHLFAEKMQPRIVARISDAMGASELKQA